MGLGFLAAFGASTLMLLGVVALVAYGAMLGFQHEDLDHNEKWHDNGWLVAAIFVLTLAYLFAIAFLALPPAMFTLA